MVRYMRAKKWWWWRWLTTMASKAEVVTNHRPLRWLVASSRELAKVALLRRRRPLAGALLALALPACSCGKLIPIEKSANFAPVLREIQDIKVSAAPCRIHPIVHCASAMTHSGFPALVPLREVQRPVGAPSDRAQEGSGHGRLQGRGRGQDGAARRAGAIAPAIALPFHRPYVGSWMSAPPTASFFVTAATPTSTSISANDLQVATRPPPPPPPSPPPPPPSPVGRCSTTPRSSTPSPATSTDRWAWRRRTRGSRAWSTTCAVRSCPHPPPPLPTLTDAPQPSSVGLASPVVRVQRPSMASA